MRIYCGKIIEPCNDVILHGWIHSLRDHGDLLFIELRDQTGIIQCIADCHINNFNQLKNITVESVVRLYGDIIWRSKNNINKNISTGYVEMHIKDYTLLSRCNEIVDLNTNDEVIKSKYRFMFLRDKKQREKINIRTEVIRKIRDYMHENAFQEIHTPLLTGSSPEGARDFKVISRLHKGKYYSLPQAPQIFKQLLMASGFDKYFQIAPCFRDEDSRADRVPTEFYQLDLECAFVEQEYIFQLIEKCIEQIFPDVKFSTMTYHEAINNYGIDKPDLRSYLKIEKSNYKISIFNKYTVQVKIKRLFSRKEIDNMNIFMKLGYNIGYISMENDSITGSLNKYINTLHEEKNTTIFFIDDDKDQALSIAGKLIQYLNSQYIKLKGYHFCWIKDFPMYKKHDGKYEFMHNPFSDVYNIDDNIDNMLAKQYDLVCNGVELGSGAIRNNDRIRMVKLFNNVGYSEDNIKNNFPALYNAFNMGTPPHGGIALGIERIVMLLTNSIYARDVIAFPPLQNGFDHMMNSPSDYIDNER